MVSRYESHMPRKSRIDAPGSLHHIIARGIDRKNIFKDDKDRDSFLERLGGIFAETQISCFAWALIPNHFHLLLKTGATPISTVMRRLLTGYAVSFNRRHRRYGHLFQNRYKSILCQEDPYFLELVRYIHLNPLRAGLVNDLRSLDKYRYSGHAVILEKRKYSWQNTEYVLRLFGEKVLWLPVWFFVSAPWPLSARWKAGLPATIKLYLQNLSWTASFPLFLRLPSESAYCFRQYPSLYTRGW